LALETHSGARDEYAEDYMVTTSTWERRDLFRNERWANLSIDTIYQYRGSAYLLHEFVIMPDHPHALITPLTSLEKAVQFIKGGFSYRVKKELGSNMEIWQKGFSDHRVRDESDYRVHATYIRQNPVRKHLCDRVEQYPYSSACGRFELDSEPQGLKPSSSNGHYGAPEGAPFQSNPICDTTKTEPNPDDSVACPVHEHLQPALKDSK
jgi:putative transposase